MHGYDKGQKPSGRDVEDESRMESVEGLMFNDIFKGTSLYRTFELVNPLSFVFSYPLEMSSRPP